MKSFTDANEIHRKMNKKQEQNEKLGYKNKIQTSSYKRHHRAFIFINTCVTHLC